MTTFLWVILGVVLWCGMGAYYGWRWVQIGDPIGEHSIWAGAVLAPIAFFVWYAPDNKDGRQRFSVRHETRLEADYQEVLRLIEWESDETTR